MEQVFYRLHVRTIRVLTSVLKPQMRNALEKVVLVNAFVAFIVLCWLHTTYVNSPPSVHNNCLYETLSRQAFAGRLADYDVIKLHLSNEQFKHFPRDEQVLRDSLSSCDAGDPSAEGKGRNASCGTGAPGPGAVGDGIGMAHLADPVADGGAFDEEQLPLLFDKYISTVGLHVDDSQPDPKGVRGRGGAGSARLYSVAGRLLSGAQAPSGSSSADDTADGAAATGPHEAVGGGGISERTAVETGTGMAAGTATATAGGEGDGPSEGVTVGGSPGCDVLTGRGCENSQLTGRLKDLFVSQRVYLFSLEKGYLMLRPDQRDRHDIRRLDITVSTDSRCFGPPAMVWLLDTFVGFDTVVMNWAIALFGGQGYLYNVYSKELFNLNFAAEFVRSGSASGSGGEDAQDRDLGSAFAAQEKRRARTSERDDNDAAAGVATSGWAQRLLSLARQTRRRLSLVGGGSRGRLSELSLSALQQFVAFKVGVVLTTVFLFFTTTTLVSFTLRETQERMLKFTFMLQHHISHRIPYAALVFTHVVETLVFVPIMVGILFFLFEFFSDQLLAFMVLSVVWLCEVFSVVCLRSGPSIRFFPRVFFCYFSMFHVYFFSFPFGFSYLALGTTVLFIQHSMLFCWNAFEIPALETGLITAVTPRVGMTVSVLTDIGAGMGVRVDGGGVGADGGIEMTPRPGRGFGVRAGAVERNVSGVVVGRNGSNSSSSSSGDSGENEWSSSDVGGEQSGRLGRRAATALASPNRMDADVGVSSQGVSGGPTRRVRRTSGGALYSPSRGPGFPASSSDTDLIDEARYAGSDATVGASGGAGFYNRHFDLSRRIQAEQLSAMLGLPSHHHHLHQPPSQPSSQTLAQVLPHVHHIHQPILPFASSTPPFVASPIHDDSPVSVEHFSAVAAGTSGPRVVREVRLPRQSGGTLSTTAADAPPSADDRTDSGDKPLLFPLSVLASVGRVVDRGLSWVVSRLAEDSESDVASEGSEWLLAPGRTNERASARSRQRAAAAAEEVGRARLRRRQDVSDEYCDDGNSDVEGMPMEQRRQRDRTDADAGWHGTPLAPRGRSSSAEHAGSPPRRLPRGTEGSPHNFPVAAAALKSPSKYEHYQRELVAYGSSDFDLSKEIEIASARTSACNSAYSSPARGALQQHPQQRQVAESAAVLVAAKAVVSPTRQMTSGGGADRSLVVPTGRPFAEYSATNEQAHNANNMSLTPRRRDDDGDDDDYVVGSKLAAETEINDNHDPPLVRADNDAAVAVGGARNRASSQCSRSSGGTGVGVGVGLQPIISSASLAGLASPGGSRDSGPGGSAVAAPLPFPQIGGITTFVADRGAALAYHGAALPAAEPLSMHSSSNTLDSSSPSSPTSLQGKRQCSIDAFGYRRSEFTIFGTNFDEEN